MQQDNSKIILISYELFDFLPLWMVETDYEITSYKILGLPVWSRRESKDTNTLIYKTKYYLFGLPICAIIEEYAEEGEEIIDNSAD